MALTITGSQVLPDTAGSMVDGTAGADVTPAQVVYLDSVTNTYKLADCNNTAATASAIGLTLHSSLIGQPIKVQRGGSPTLGAGAAPAVGTIYVLGAAPGAIEPASALTTGWRTVILGVGATGNKLAMSLFNSLQTVP